LLGSRPSARASRSGGADAAVRLPRTEAIRQRIGYLGGPPAGYGGGERGPSSGVRRGPNLREWPTRPGTVAAPPSRPSGRRTRLLKRTVHGTWGSAGSPYHSGWSPWASTVTTLVPPTPGGL